MSQSHPDTSSSKSVKPKVGSGLFDPININGLALQNRIAMAPMGRLFADTNGVIAEGYSDYYCRRIEGGTALIIGEASGVSEGARSNPTSPNFYGEALEAWKAPIKAIKDAGGAFMPQLWHAGLARAPGSKPNPDVASIGPSDWYIPNVDEQLHPRPGYRFGKPMSESQIADVIAAFADAAMGARDLGCDGVEIHGAHGYLIDQFFWPEMNRRTDRYGGEMRNRARFGAEVVSAIRKTVGPDFPILFRFSQWKLQDYNARTVHNPQELAELVEPLADAGVDLFHVSVRRFWEPAFADNKRTLAGWTKMLSGRFVMTVGSVSLDSAFGVGTDDYANHFLKANNAPLDLASPATLDRLYELFDQGEFDMVAIGRAMLANPEWTDIVREGAFDRLKPYSRETLQKLY